MSRKPTSTAATLKAARRHIAKELRQIIDAETISGDGKGGTYRQSLSGEARRAIRPHRLLLRRIDTALTEMRA
jgi:hypothetical protein